MNHDQGGYYHVYRPRGAEAAGSELRPTPNDRYARMDTALGEFARMPPARARRELTPALAALFEEGASA